MRLKPASFLMFTLLAAACNKGGDSAGTSEAPATDGGGPGPDQGPQCDTAAGKIVVGSECVDPDNSTATDTDTSQLTGGTLDVQLVQAGSVALTTALVGQAEVNGTTTQLESLQYRFQSIQICEEMQVNGTGFSNPKNCLEIYREPQGAQADYGNLPPSRNDKNPNGSPKFATQAAFDDAVLAYEAEVKARHTAAAADTQNYVDLMDPKAIAKLSSKLKLSAKDAHKYSYGLVNWYRPIKVKATIPLIGDGTTVYTKDGVGAIEVVGSDSYLKHVTKATGMTSAPAELAVIEHPNGGAWFNFPRPFEITEKDIETKKNFKLKLTFNPDGIAKAFDNEHHGSLTDETDHVSISIPMLQLTPIAHGVDQVVQKEVYKVESVPASGQPFYCRIEVYSIKNDPAKAVYGVASQVLFGAGSTVPVMDMAQAFFLSQDKVDGKEILTMQDYQKVPFLKLPRLAKTGDTATVKFKSACLGGHPGFILPQRQPMDCMATPDQSFEDDVTVKLDSVVDLP